ncbi:MAG: outer membrane lipoprotein carrier protein LolA [Deltaproteobacteria bacterium]|jgi:outer membrane lipoprotein carrier protein|nr:MAG: outer membrane lipoprotein carrier protein LolA [Deltaproteobacteria bacterium]TMB14622.1 MAG: outer membrane lipoprotein carrier protein LolA [Deltaproteobacteria bacterium]
MAALLLALLLAVPAKDPGRALAQRVQAFYAHSKDFSASFRQHYTYVAIGRTEDSEGVVQVKKPGLVRWDYANPERRTLYIEGRTLWIWRPDDQEAQVKRDFGGEQLSSAFTFLWGKGNLLKEFSPKSVPTPAGLPQGDALELTPLKPVAGVQKLLFVVAKDGQVLASVVTNPQGDVNQIVFSEAKVDQGLPDSLFHFAPPKGAYVQEL